MNILETISLLKNAVQSDKYFVVDDPYSEILSLKANPSKSAVVFEANDTEFESAANGMIRSQTHNIDMTVISSAVNRHYADYKTEGIKLAEDLTTQLLRTNGPKYMIQVKNQAYGETLIGALKATVVTVTLAVQTRR